VSQTPTTGSYLAVAAGARHSVAIQQAAVSDTTLCATLGDDRPPSRLDQDIFTFTLTFRANKNRFLRIK
jgi:hypothetical protein